MNHKDRYWLTHHTDRQFRRTRTCEDPACGVAFETRELHRLRWAESCSDRCPWCIVGKGKTVNTSLRWDRGRQGRVNDDADEIGAVIRRYECTNGCKDNRGRLRRWNAWEMRADGADSPDITICTVCRTGARTRLRQRRP